MTLVRPDIGRLAGSSQDEATALRNAGVRTLNDLWEEAAANAQTGLHPIGGIQTDRLVELLAAEAAREGRLRDGSWRNAQGQWRPSVSDGTLLRWLRHAAALQWPVGIAIVMLAAAAVLGVRASSTVSPAQSWQTTTKTHLRAYHVIVAGDLARVKTARVAHSFLSPSDLEGRFMRQDVAAGATLTASQVSPGKLQPSQQAALKSDQIVTLPVAAGAHSPTLTPGDTVTLLFSLRTSPSGKVPEGTQVPGLLLDVVKQGGTTSVVVAMAPNNVKAVMPIVGRSDVFVTQFGSR